MNIYQKLVAVRKAVTGIAKDAQTQSAGRFKYVSSNNILSELRPHLDEQGLLLECRVTSARLHDKWFGKFAADGKDTGQNEHLTELDVEFVWVNADNPEERIVCPFYGQGLDTGEKGVGKALTYAEKYFLLKFFNIPTDDDDPDAGHGSNGNSTAPARPAPQAASPRPQQTRDVDRAQYGADGTPANAAAERFDQTRAQTAYPDPDVVTDYDTFLKCMVALSIKSPSSVDRAAKAAGYDPDTVPMLGMADLQAVYAKALAVKLAADAKKAGAAA